MTSFLRREADNVFKKFRSCLLDKVGEDEYSIGPAFVPGCAFNEWVMIRLLETTYLEDVLVCSVCISRYSSLTLLYADSRSGELGSK